MSTTTRAALTALCATALTTTLAATPTSAASTAYVALGDSFSAGTGTRAPVDGCYRSTYGYPALLADRLRLTLDYQACSGATTADVHANQLGTLGTGTGFVTMTIGGNDVGFADVITECALPGWLSDCGGHIDAARTVLQTQLPQRLDTLYGAIRTKAPAAKVVVAGYPYLFNGEDCNAATFFSRAEMTDLNAGTAELDDLIVSRTTAIGFTYVEVRDDFRGHAVCDDTEWINGLSSPVVESYHPNRQGNVGYADALAPALKGTTGGGGGGKGKPGPKAATTEPTVREAAATVLAMELDSPTNLQRAEAQGVDKGRVARAVAKLRSPHVAVQEAGLDELQALEEEFGRG